MLKDVSSVLESSVSNSKEIEIEVIDLSSMGYIFHNIVGVIPP
jgi:hypothetical protein